MKDPLEEASESVDRRGATKILVLVILLLVALAIFRPGARDALAIVFGIVLMVMLHEAGHYFTAKRAGMKTTEFFLGFGPRLWSFKRGETEYGVKAIPAGGYVRILGMSNLEQPIEDERRPGHWVHDFSPDDEPRTFRRGTYKNRLVVVLAGVTVNILLAFVLFYAVIAGQGRVAEGPSTTVQRVVAGSAAADAGFEPGDKIVAVDGRRVQGWEGLKDAIEEQGDETTVFTVARDGSRLTLEATPEERDGQGFLGIAPTIASRAVGPFEAVPESFRAMGDIVVGTGEGFARWVSPSGVERLGNSVVNAPESGTPASDERPRSLIGIVDEGSRIVDGNVWALLWLLGGISLILAVFNLIPLLPFDGGHAAILGYEWIASKVRGRPVRVDYAKLMPVSVAVFGALLMFGLIAMAADISSLAR